MKTIKDIAIELFKSGVPASMQNADRYVEKHYDIALPAYFADEHADLHLLDALIDTLTVSDYESSIRSSLKINTELMRAMEHAASLIHDEWLEVEFEARQKGKKPREHFEEIDPNEVPF